MEVLTEMGFSCFGLEFKWIGHVLHRIVELMLEKLLGWWHHEVSRYLGDNNGGSHAASLGNWRRRYIWEQQQRGWKIITTTLISTCCLPRCLGFGPCCREFGAPIAFIMERELWMNRAFFIFRTKPTILFSKFWIISCISHWLSTLFGSCSGYVSSVAGLTCVCRDGLTTSPGPKLSRSVGCSSPGGTGGVALLIKSEYKAFVPALRKLVKPKSLLQQNAGEQQKINH